MFAKRSSRPPPELGGERNPQTFRCHGASLLMIQKLIAMTCSGLDNCWIVELTSRRHRFCMLRRSAGA